MELLDDLVGLDDEKCLAALLKIQSKAANGADLIPYFLGIVVRWQTNLYFLFRVLLTGWRSPTSCPLVTASFGCSATPSFRATATITGKDGKNLFRYLARLSLLLTQASCRSKVIEVVFQDLSGSDKDLQVEALHLIPNLPGSAFLVRSMPLRSVVCY
jgi:hypothetical protein